MPLPNFPQLPELIPALPSREAGGGVATRQAHGTYTAEEVLLLYRSTLPEPIGNRRVYLSYARAYVKFCLEGRLLIGELSASEFLVGRAASRKAGQDAGAALGVLKPDRPRPGAAMRSLVRRFVKFCARRGIRELLPGRTPRLRARHPHVLAFLSEIDVKSAHTRRTYGQAVDQFLSWRADRDRPYSLATVNAWLTHLTESGPGRDRRSSFTVNLYLAAVKQFTRWALDKGTLGIEASQTRDLVRILSLKAYPIQRGYWKDSLSEVQRTVLVAGTANARERLLLCLLSFEGLRASEPASLRVGDLDVATATLRIAGKGKTQPDTIKLFAPTRQALADYLATWPTPARADAQLFEGLHYHHVWRIVDRALRAIGVKLPGAQARGHKLSPHSLRHTAAQLLMQRKVHPDYIQRQLRHADAQTTQLYTRKLVEERFLDELPEQ